MEFLLQLLVGGFVLGATAALLGGASRWGQRWTALGAITWPVVAVGLAILVIPVVELVKLCQRRAAGRKVRK